MARRESAANSRRDCIQFLAFRAIKSVEPRNEAGDGLRLLAFSKERPQLFLEGNLIDHADVLGRDVAVTIQ